MRKNLQENVVIYMVDITSRDDERSAENARLKGQEEEKERQRELDRVKEQARKEGQDEEKEKQRNLERAKEQALKDGKEQERNRQPVIVEKQGGSSWLKIALYLLVFVGIIGVIALFSLNVSVTPVTTEYALPWTTMYAVTFPEGQTISVGSSQVNVLSYENELISDIDGNRQKLIVGESRVIQERRAVITTFGVIKLMDINFKIELEYKGQRSGEAYFDMAVHTSQQVPEMLMKQIIPKQINAQPM